MIPHCWDCVDCVVCSMRACTCVSKVQLPFQNGCRSQHICQTACLRPQVFSSLCHLDTVPFLNDVTQIPTPEWIGRTAGTWTRVSTLQWRPLLLAPISMQALCLSTACMGSCTFIYMCLAASCSKLARLPPTVYDFVHAHGVRCQLMKASSMHADLGHDCFRISHASPALIKVWMAARWPCWLPGMSM